MILDAEDDGIWTCDEAVISYGSDHVCMQEEEHHRALQEHLYLYLYLTFQQNLPSDGVSVTDDGLPIVSVPTVQLHTATALQQVADVAIDGGEAGELVALEVGVVRGGDEVVAEGEGHVLVDDVLLSIEQMHPGVVDEHVTEHGVRDGELLLVESFGGGVQRAAVAGRGCCRSLGLDGRDLGLGSHGVSCINQLLRLDDCQVATLILLPIQWR